MTLQEREKQFFLNFMTEFHLEYHANYFSNQPFLERNLFDYKEIFRLHLERSSNAIC